VAKVIMSEEEERRRLNGTVTNEADVRLKKN
jgi:hypothetical protein